MEREQLHDLYETYADDIFRYVRYAIGSREDAEDLVHDIFIKAFHSFDQFQQRASAKTWLIAIARHTIADYYRRRQRGDQRVMSLSELQDVAPNKDADASLRLDLESALGTLSPSDRDAFLLRYVMGFSVRETAQVLAWSEIKLRVMMHRTNKRLRGLLQIERQEGGSAHGNLE